MTEKPSYQPQNLFIYDRLQRIDGGMKIELGIKSDPVEYRYSYEWLFRIMEQENVTHLQLGTFFELYQLPG
jgi:hypothetical protein